MAVTLYRSTDGSAPTLSGTAGDLVNVLDKCLVAGYGSQTAAGWTKSFTGTNTATFQQGSGSNSFYLHVNDSGPGAGGAKEARVFGSEAASAVLTGTVLFPTAAQAANGIFVRKSAAADATTRAWRLIADSRTFYMFIDSGDGSALLCWAFGEFYSYRPGTDNGRCLLIARPNENNAGISNANEVMDNQCVSQNTISGHYLARDQMGDAGGVACGKMGGIDLITSGSATNIALQGNVSYKNGADSNIYLSPIRLITGANGYYIRGHLRGLWHFGHPISNAADGDTITGAGSLNGKSFQVVKPASTSGGIYIIETSNTWDSN
jgi:hypothetical protein